MTPASSAGAVTKDGILFSDSRLLDLSMEDAKIQTLSYDVDEDDDEFQELEVRDCINIVHLVTNSLSWYSKPVLTSFLLTMKVNGRAARFGGKCLIGFL